MQLPFVPVTNKNPDIRNPSFESPKHIQIYFAPLAKSVSRSSLPRTATRPDPDERGRTQSNQLNRPIVISIRFVLAQHANKY